MFVAMFMSWLQSRHDEFLYRMSMGALFIAAGMPLAFPAVNENSLAIPALAFLLMMAGFSSVYVAAIRFHGGKVKRLKVLKLTVAAWLPCGFAYALGLGGMGVAFGNFAGAALLVSTGAEYRHSYREAPRQVALLSILYIAEAVTFILCGIMVLLTTPFYLTGFPVNWAEDLNAIMAIVGITGIGAVSLSLHQVRQAAMHRVQAMTDSLTGLLNRRAIFDRFGKRPLQGRTAVALLDLDNFKAVNDTYGHECGDDALRRFSECVLSILPEDAIAARVGGEEFAVVLPSSSMESAESCMESLRTAFALEDIMSESGPVRCTISVGIAYSGSDGMKFSELVRQADKALYRAKQDGRNRVVRAAFEMAA